MNNFISDEYEGNNNVEGGNEADLQPKLIAEILIQNDQAFFPMLLT